MSWLTPDVLEEGVNIERRYSSYGFGALISAAKYPGNKDAKDAISEYWDPYDLGDFAVETGKKIAEQEGVSFLAWMVAASIHADLSNRRAIDAMLPGFDLEVRTRYNTPGGMLPGEVMEVGGALYQCAGEAIGGMADYRVNTHIVKVFHREAGKCQLIHT